MADQHDLARAFFIITRSYPNQTLPADAMHDMEAAILAQQTQTPTPDAIYDNRGREVTE